MSVRQGQL
jgi:hypothetical protein